jgi:hypothetical protein
VVGRVVDVVVVDVVVVEWWPYTCVPKYRSHTSFTQVGGPVG